MGSIGSAVLKFIGYRQLSDLTVFIKSKNYCKLFLILEFSAENKKFSRTIFLAKKLFKFFRLNFVLIEDIYKI